MAAGIPARLSRADARKFGLQVGAAFLALAALSLWRGRTLPASVLGTLGGTLVLFGTLLPEALAQPYRAWMGLSHLLSRVTTPVFMALVYFVVLTPVAVLRRVIGGNPLRPRGRPDSLWVKVARETRPDGDAMDHQF